MKTDAKGNPVLDQFSEEGFVDLTFRISGRADDKKHFRFHLSASHKRKVVGMDAVVVKGIQGGFNAKMKLVEKHIYRPGVRLLRSGPESDRLIAAIGELYDLGKSPRTMVSEETFTAIALHQGRIDLENEPVKLKLFGRDAEPIAEEVYYESFFNVDLANGFVFWNEKDPDYRERLLRGLTAE